MGLEIFVIWVLSDCVLSVLMFFPNDDIIYLGTVRVGILEGQGCFP